MVRLSKPWLICGYHGLTTILKNMKVFFLALFVVKPSLIFVNDWQFPASVFFIDYCSRLLYAGKRYLGYFVSFKGFY